MVRVLNSVRAKLVVKLQYRVRGRVLIKSQTSILVKVRT